MSKPCRHCGVPMVVNKPTGRFQCAKQKCPGKIRVGVRKFVHYCKSRMGVEPFTSRAVLVAWVEFMGEQLGSGKRVYLRQLGTWKTTRCRGSKTPHIIKGKAYFLPARLVITFRATPHLKNIAKKKYEQLNANTDRSLGATPPANG